MSVDELLHNDHALSVLSKVFGWIYFVAWSISFYPQFILNFRRKSVVGLSFDFMVLNITGFTCYSFYNLMFYFSNTVKDEYLAKHPHDSIPVEPNDVAFALHALTISILTGVQCFFYERRNQRVSLFCMILTHECWAYVLVFCAIAGAGKVTWLSAVTYISYVKLLISFVKYIPQAVMNFRRKCTAGWSIHNIMLDLTGGLFSFAQMFVDSSRDGNWSNFIGNPVKLGLSLLSIAFDIIFIIQHFVLYRGNPEPEELSSDAHQTKNGNSVNSHDEDEPLLRAI